MFKFQMFQTKSLKNLDFENSNLFRIGPAGRFARYSGFEFSERKLDVD